jgi:hypothetical protein
VARGIAEALVAVGAGASYRQAALVSRERARRLPGDPRTGELRMTRHGQLVGDWVEVFAPVVFEAHRPVCWPPTGSLLLDDLPFSLRDHETGRFRIAFRVFCATGFEGGRPKLWRLEAFTTKSQADSERFGQARRRARAGRLRQRRGTHKRGPGALPTPSCSCVSGSCATRSSG